MANELTMSGSLSYSDSQFVSDALSILKSIKSVSAHRLQHTFQTIQTTETALQLGSVTSPGYVFIVNRDTTNYVDVKVAASGAIFARLDPDVNANGKVGCCLVKLGAGA
jgi:hypothetical protein